MSCWVRLACITCSSAARPSTVTSLAVLYQELGIAYSYVLLAWFVQSAGYVGIPTQVVPMRTRPSVARASVARHRPVWSNERMRNVRHPFFMRTRASLTLGPNGGGSVWHSFSRCNFSPWPPSVPSAQAPSPREVKTHHRAVTGQA
eukprot:2630443-Rhodomonas_salina.1